MRIIVYFSHLLNVYGKNVNQQVEYVNFYFYSGSHPGIGILFIEPSSGISVVSDYVEFGSGIVRVVCEPSSGIVVVVDYVESGSGIVIVVDDVKSGSGIVLVVCDPYCGICFHL